MLNNILKEIKASRKMTLMEVCGGHTHTIMKYGIRDAIPKNIRLISGPGCPVCVSSQKDIDCMIEIANKGIPVATYGDMLRVPGSKGTLDDARRTGAIVLTVYSAEEVIRMKEEYPEIVFFGIGFETTAPMTTFLLENDICVYSVHKTIPEAMEILAKEIDGFISPGHVATIIGEKEFERVKTAQVISGFSPEQMVRSIYLLTNMIENKKTGVINGYPEAVSREGNHIAQDRMKKYFKKTDSEWRGLGIIPDSGLEVRDDRLNAKKKYKKLIERIEGKENPACRCGEVLQGMDPRECSLFKKKCNPENPQGACMVSEEGSCQIAYRYNG
ncbi:MAG: hydrogenase formation protein HypD [Candidatus Woesearchaeota archaeon]